MQSLPNVKQNETTREKKQLAIDEKRMIANGTFATVYESNIPAFVVKRTHLTNDKKKYNAKHQQTDKVDDDNDDDKKPHSESGSDDSDADSDKSGSDKPPKLDPKYVPKQVSNNIEHYIIAESFLRETSCQQFVNYDQNILSEIADVQYHVNPKLTEGTLDIFLPRAQMDLSTYSRTLRKEREARESKRRKHQAAEKAVKEKEKAAVLEKEKTNKHGTKSNKTKQQQKQQQQQQHVSTSFANVFDEPDLKAIVRQRKREKILPDTHICDMMFQILYQLQRSHACQVAHRDLKPENVLIYPVDQRKAPLPASEIGVNPCDASSIDSSFPSDSSYASALATSEYKTLFIGDWGISRFMVEPVPCYGKEQCCTEGKYVCTLPYRAPELEDWQCHYDTKLDIWSAGIIMLNLLMNVNYGLASPTNYYSSKNFLKGLVTSFADDEFKQHYNNDIEKLMHPHNPRKNKYKAANGKGMDGNVNNGRGKKGGKKEKVDRNNNRKLRSSGKFGSDDEHLLYLLNEKDNEKIVLDEWKYLVTELYGSTTCDLLFQLLRMRPEQRTHAYTALRHPYFQAYHSRLEPIRMSCLNVTNVATFDEMSLHNFLHIECTRNSQLAWLRMSILTRDEMCYLFNNDGLKLYLNIVSRMLNTATLKQYPMECMFLATQLFQRYLHCLIVLAFDNLKSGSHKSEHPVTAPPTSMDASVPDFTKIAYSIYQLKRQHSNGSASSTHSSTLNSGNATAAAGTATTPMSMTMATPKPTPMSPSAATPMSASASSVAATHSATQSVPMLQHQPCFSWSPSEITWLNLVMTMCLNLAVGASHNQLRNSTELAKTKSFDSDGSRYYNFAQLEICKKLKWNLLHPTAIVYSRLIMRALGIYNGNSPVKPYYSIEETFSDNPIGRRKQHEGHQVLPPEEYLLMKSLTCPSHESFFSPCVLALATIYKVYCINEKKQTQELQRIRQQWIVLNKYLGISESAMVDAVKYLTQLEDLPTHKKETWSLFIQSTQQYNY